MHTPRLRVKFCGMTRHNDLMDAAALGVDAVGLIFYPQSTRAVTIEVAKKITRTLPPFLSVVGVFVNPTVELVRQAMSVLPLHYLQFHGDESPEFCEQFNRAYIKSVSAHSTEAILDMAKLHIKACALLLETPSLVNHGGSGTSFDWRIIPRTSPKPLILAGGINLANVGTASKEQGIYGIDVCSGIEQSPGIKDYDKMCQFVKVLESINHE